MVIKNNNNHLRLESLVNCFTSCYFIFTYRDPIYQAFSLLNQHLNFIKLQKKDEFILEYMNLIGHFENNVMKLFFEKIPCEIQRILDM